MTLDVLTQAAAARAETRVIVMLTGRRSFAGNDFLRILPQLFMAFAILRFVTQSHILCPRAAILPSTSGIHHSMLKR